MKTIEQVKSFIKKELRRANLDFQNSELETHISYAAGECKVGGKILDFIDEEE